MKLFVFLALPLVLLCQTQLDYKQVKSGPGVSVTAYGADPTGARSSLVALSAAFAANPRGTIFVPPGTYLCTNPTMATRISVNAAAVYADGATFTGGCLFTTTGATGGLTWEGGTFDTTLYAFAGTPASPIFQVSQDHTSFDNVRFRYRRNYTAIQIAGATLSSCVDDVSLTNIVTETNGQSHITPTCVTNMRVNNWTLGDGGLARDPGLGNYDDGLALFSLSGATHDVTLTNITASHVYDILKITNNQYAMANVTLSGFTCNSCVVPIWIEAAPVAGVSQPVNNILISNGASYDSSGANMVNFVYLYSDGVEVNNIAVTGLAGYGRFNNGTSAAGWIRILGLNGGVYTNVNIEGNSFLSPTSGSGSFPLATILGQTNVSWSGFKVKNNITNGGSARCLELGSVQFATAADLDISGNHFSNCNTSSPTAAAHAIYNRTLWANNDTALAANQIELASSTATYFVGVSYAELSSTAYLKKAPGTTLYCYDCGPTTPATSRTATIGGSTCVMFPANLWSCNPQYPQYSYIDIPRGLQTGTNNAISCAAGCGPTLAAGLTVRLLSLAFTLQAGANTFAYNGGSAAAIKRSSNPSSDLGTAYAAFGVISLFYDGSVWMDLAQ